MLRKLPLLLVVAILVLGGVVHGLWTDRWHKSPALEEALARLDTVPLVIGDWQGQALETDEEQRVQAEAAGCLHRRYENRQTGSAVSILLVCGRPGPVSVHPPDVCFQGVGYESAAPPHRQEVQADAPAAAATLWAATFIKRNAAGPRHLAVYWSWSAAGTWEAAGNPRLAFARFPVLYKLYVFREAPGEADLGAGEDPCLAFLRPLLPELQQALFPTP
jgi:hypothetical protein